MKRLINRIVICLMALGAVLVLALSMTLVTKVEGQGGDPRNSRPSSAPKKTTTKKTTPPAKRYPTNPSSTNTKTDSSTSSSNVKPTNASGSPGAAPKPGTVIRNQIGMEFVWIPPGSFMMGLSDAEAQSAYKEAKALEINVGLGWFNPAKPKHQVTIREGFYMGRYEVTQGQWQKVIGTSLRQHYDKAELHAGINGEGESYPMYYVNWDEAQEFVQKLDQLNDGYTYRLPTEAEWEYAARAGTTTTYFWGEDGSRACQYANVADQAGKEKEPNWGIVQNCRDGYAYNSPVGSFQPNASGLYDIVGNVDEWCEDWYHDSYNGAPADGSAWSSKGEHHYRVIRGASWQAFGIWLPSAVRDSRPPDFRTSSEGFRVVAVARTK